LIEIGLDARKLTLPRAKPAKLYDCSDKFQLCLADGHRFAFAYFRNCEDAAPLGNYRRLKFQPKIVSVLHDDLWMVFDASPNLMFHYVRSAGLVGIYVGRKPSFDFRTLLRKRDLNLSDYEKLEYRIASPGTIAACK